MTDSLNSFNSNNTLADSVNTANSNTFKALTDSAFLDSTQTVVQPLLETNALFHVHLLPFKYFYPQTIEKVIPDWYAIILISIIMAVTLLKVFYSKIFFQIFKAFINNNTANQIVRDENLLVQRASIILSVICYVVLALFTFIVSQHYNYENQYIGSGFAKFMFIAIFIALAYTIKMITLKIFSFIFNYEKPVAAYIFNLFLINNVLGIILLPLLIFLSYSNTGLNNLILLSCIGIIVIFLIYRLIKGIIIWTGIPRHNLFYLFLYICALEITPLLIILKIISL